MPKSSPAIEVSDVWVSYGDVRALEGASLRIADGTVCGLVGMNGSGKSTLFKAIMGTVSLERGSIRLADRTPTKARRAGLVAYVPQNEHVDWTFPISVREVVMMGRYGRMGPLRRARASDTDAVDDALARVGMRHLADRQIGQLSGGQRRRAFVARALGQQARVLLLDEPFAGVDAATEADLSTLLRELAATGAAVLISTHDLRALPQLCDEVVLFRHRTVLHAPPAEALRAENLVRAFGLQAAA